MRKLIYFICTFGVFMCLEGCLPRVTPHENFLEHLNSFLNKDIDMVPKYELPPFVESNVLENGNFEYMYKHQGPKADQRPCVWFLEINPKTRLVKRFRYEGKDSDCTIAL